LDEAILRYIVQLRHPWLDDVMVFASAIGAGGFVWFAVATIAMLFPRRRQPAWRVLLAIWFTWFIVDGVIKPFVDRARPFDVLDGIQLLDQRPTNASFPSGHAAMAFAGALALSRLFPSFKWLWWPFATLVAVSRVYLGVHWPTDVIAGMAIGTASGWFVLGGRNKFRGSGV
jgi:undecaprenyl-diphosphatase